VSQGPETQSTDTADAASLPQLITRLTEQTSTLVRDEVQLAKTEIQQSVKDAGLGAGLFGTAGVVALYGVGALVAAAILGLGQAVDPWLAALIVSVVLLVIAAVVALAGKNKVQQAGPPMAATRENVQRDLDTVKGARR
jgi:uncharacterized membrane protein YqjE